MQYGYADGSNNHIRQTSLTYPNGRVITYDFGSSASIDDVLSRVRAIKDGTFELAAYSFVGAGFFVQVDYTEPDIRYDLATGGGSDPYDGGLDRFDRTIDLRWINYATSTDVERLKHGYDRADNRLWMERLADSNRFHDELYTYDGVNRLKTFKRGTLNTGHTAMTTLKFAQEWGLDPTGNWSSFKEDSNGDTTWDLVQTRTSNKVNEITEITETTGPSWATPIYNKAGSMTTVPKPLLPTAGFTSVWDAWQRSVSVLDGGNSVSDHAYDGRDRRIVCKTYSDGILSETRHHFFTVTWQNIEERVGTATAAERHWVWGRRFVDDLVLRDRDTNADGTLDQRLYSSQDGIWNVVSLITSTGAVQERFRYAAYGVSSVLTAAFADAGSSAFAWDVRSHGYRFDAATGLLHVRHRFNHSMLGNWISRDHLGLDIGDANLLRYVLSNPTNLVDPTGEAWFGCWPVGAEEHGFTRKQCADGSWVVCKATRICTYGIFENWWAVVEFCPPCAPAPNPPSIVDVIPIAGTIKCALSDTAGTRVNDYASCMVTAAACRAAQTVEDKQVLIQQCIACIDGLVAQFGVGGATGGLPRCATDWLIGASTAAITGKIGGRAFLCGTGVGAVLTIDTLISGYQTIVAFRDIAAAANRAKRLYCRCD